MVFWAWRALYAQTVHAHLNNIYMNLDQAYAYMVALATSRVTEHTDAAGEYGTSNSDSFTLSDRKLWHSGTATSNSLLVTNLLSTQSMPPFLQYAAAPSNNSDNLTDSSAHMPS